MSLFDHLQQYETPAAPAVADVAAPECAVIIKHTRCGQPIMVCTVEPAPQHIIERANAEGLPLFVPSEINTLAGANPEAVYATIMTKLAMPGSSVIQHQKDSNA